MGVTTELRLLWLGHPRVLAGESILRFETKKAQALLCYLSMSEAAVSRERLVDLLWPDFDRTRAPANLRRTLFSLGRSLGKGRILADRGTLGLPAGATCPADARVFKTLLREARSHPHGPACTCGSCRDLVLRAVALYAGDFLEGFSLKDAEGFERWQILEREGLSADLAWALDRLAAIETATGQWGAATETMRRRVALDPIDDEANRRLMRILVLSGKRNAALKHYAHYEEILHRELGEAPLRATRDLARAIQEESCAAEEPPLVASSPEVCTASLDAEAAPSWPFLATKLFLPTMAPGFIRRPRLESLLDGATRRALTLVSAPAGFGKSSLVAAWASAVGMAVAWVSLDEEDNDPLRFVGYLVAALEKARPGLGEGALALLRGRQAVQPKALISVLLGAIEKTEVDLLLVLDDFQSVTEPSVSQCLQYLLERLPRRLHLILATRSDPALPLARLRAQGELEEIRSSELRFTDQEAEHFLRESMGLDLDQGQLALLKDGTEGWIAGLKLAALSLRGQEDIDPILRGFGGSNRFVFDYLIEEVYAGLGEQILDFLLPCSILSRFCAKLCEAVAQKPGGEDFLQRLESDNLFLVPLDTERRWYRLHRLFADIARHKLGKTRTADAIADLHRRAAGWLSLHGSLEEAMAHFLAAGDYGAAGNLLVKETQGLALAGRYGQVLHWIQALPPELVAGWPELNFQKGQALTFAGRIDETGPIVEEMETAIASIGDPERRRSLGVALGLARAFHRFMQGDLAGSLESALGADELVEVGDGRFHGGLFWILLTVYRSLGKWREAAAAARKYMAMTRITGDLWAFSNGSTEYVYILRSQGKVRDAMVLCRRILAMAEAGGEGGLVWLARVYSLLADLERCQNSLKAADLHIREAECRAELWGSPSDLSNCYIIGANIAISLGDLDLASGRLAKAEAALPPGGSIPGIEGMLKAGKARLALARGDREGARAWLGEARFASATDLRAILLCAEIRLRRLLDPTGRCAENIAALNACTKECEESGRSGRLPELLCLRAMERERGGDRAAALSDLELALDLAQPEGLAAVFCDEGPAMRYLLGVLLALPGPRPGPGLGFARELIAALPPPA